MFVWAFHRVSGLLLILLIGLQMVTGLLQMQTTNPALAQAAMEWHRNPFCMTLLGSLVILHALYGLRTVLIDLGVRQERALFWICTLVGLILTAVFLGVFFTLLPESVPGEEP